MANGEQFENTAKQNVDHKANEASEALFADSQKAPPKALDNAATKAPDAPSDKVEQVASAEKLGDKTGDKTVSKLEQSVTDNLAVSAKEKLDSLNSSPEGQKLLTQKHSDGKNIMEQWKETFPQAYEKAFSKN
ncbi:MAG: hypothetical protein WCT03_27225 [Candidatus Obscuribacterales bacterium]|jgi:hypothetical protein